MPRAKDLAAILGRTSRVREVDSAFASSGQRTASGKSLRQIVEELLREVYDQGLDILSAQNFTGSSKHGNTFS